MTDSKSVINFFQTKLLSHPYEMTAILYCNLIYHFTHPTENGHRSRFSSRSEKDPNEKIIFKIREDIATKSIELNIGSTGIAKEESVFFDTTDQQ